VKEIKRYQKKWLQHVQRMDRNRAPKQALKYRPKGQRNTGRPKKRWRDQLHFEDQGTGNTPNPSWTWWWWWWWWTCWYVQKLNYVRKMWVGCNGNLGSLVIDILSAVVFKKYQAWWSNDSEWIVDSLYEGMTHRNSSADTE